MKKRNLRLGVFGLFLCFGLIFVFCLLFNSDSLNEKKIKKSEYGAVNKKLSTETQELLVNIGNGYNIGNSYDSQGALGYNGLPSGSDGLKKFFTFVRKTGFTSVRIPMASYHKITDTANNTISSDWLDTLENVVDTALAADLYLSLLENVVIFLVDVRLLLILLITKKVKNI